MRAKTGCISRRGLLLGAAAAAFGGADARGAKKEELVRIDRIDLFPVRYPTIGYFKFLAGPQFLDADVLARPLKIAGGVARPPARDSASRWMIGRSAT